MLKFIYIYIYIHAPSNVNINLHLLVISFVTSTMSFDYWFFIFLRPQSLLKFVHTTSWITLKAHKLWAHNMELWISLKGSTTCSWSSRWRHYWKEAIWKRRGSFVELLKEAKQSFELAYQSLLNNQPMIMHRETNLQKAFGRHWPNITLTKVWQIKSSWLENSSCPRWIF